MKTFKFTAYVDDNVLFEGEYPTLEKALDRRRMIMRDCLRNIEDNGDIDKYGIEDALFTSDSYPYEYDFDCYAPGYLFVIEEEESR